MVTASDSLSIALIQADLHWEDWQKNKALFDQKMAQLPAELDLVVLPEMFTSGFTQSPKAVAQSMGGETIEWMLETARRLNSTIVGSAVIEENDWYFNRMIWAMPNGDVSTYDKKHLFTFANEHHHYAAGTKQHVVDVKGWKIASHICFDLRFPAWCRNTQQNTYDIALFIASWPAARREQWKALLRARAIENQAFVVAVNRVGTDGNNIAYSGDSQVIDPLGEVRFQLCQDEGLHVAKLEKATLQDIRGKFPFLQESDVFVFS